MMNKKGSLVLRDMVFMMMILSGIFVLAGMFVSDMATNYNNVNMSNEWGITGTNVLANSTFYDVGDNVTETGESLSSNSTGIYSLISGVGNTLKGIGKALFMVLTAPNTIGDLVEATLIDMEVVDDEVAKIIKYLIAIVLWVVVIFTIASAFLRGPRV